MARAGSAAPVRRTARVERANREPGVEGRDEQLAQIGVRGRDRGDPGDAQFRRQPLLQRAEHPLDAAAGLRRVGRDVADAELAEDDLASIMGRLNATPRRCLGYRTPKEAFQDQLAALARAA